MNRAFQPMKNTNHDSHWLSVSDLMAGLMMVFLCISVVMMRSMLVERDKIRTVAVSYQENQMAIYQSLIQEFSADLPRWGATIDKDTLTVAFHTSSAMFETGKTTISQSYQITLSEFFPRYMKVLEPFRTSIEEIRLEGHTNSEWKTSESRHTAYFNNLALSQDRTRSVLIYVSSLDTVSNYQDWMIKHIAAVGYSSSRPLLHSDGSEDHVQSKRVAFRIITNSEVKIKSILENTL